MTVSRSGLCPSVPPCIHLSLPSSFLSPSFLFPFSFALHRVRLTSYSTILSFLLPPPPSLSFSFPNSFSSPLSLACFYPLLHVPTYVYPTSCMYMYAYVHRYHFLPFPYNLLISSFSANLPNLYHFFLLPSYIPLLTFRCVTSV